MLGISGGSNGGTVAPFNPSVTVSSTATIDSGSGASDWVGRPSVKRRPSDNALVLTYTRKTGHASTDGPLHIRFSDDDGATWTALDTALASDGGGAISGFPMNPEDYAGEPWLMVAPNGDLLVHTWGLRDPGPSVGTYQSRSTDGGLTWSIPVNLDFGGITGDTTIYSTDDDFVFDRTIYAGARKFSGSDVKSMLVKSADNGETWEWVSDISSYTTDTQEVGIEYVGNDTIVAILRAQNNDHTYRAISTDMGATWGSLTNMDSAIGISGRHRLYTRMHLRGEAGWWKDPTLFMCGFIFPTPGSSQPRRNAVWFSPDRGTTWDGPHYIDSQDTDGGYGDLFWDFTNDRLGVVMYKGSSLNAATLKQYGVTVDLAP